ncbi:VCBS repeat-containing protein [Algoriphagus lutimaris]|uniref:VCBS repeat-containing protein n=1 Tax=Algoriphagus lutimaris TaxID=613197 RepID=UPI00196AA28C|nr:VCBS repeat-containing protein [Algoriphagus lutimaris]MBN3521860.1 VCBS repeat-containing protein [Algoriphagus lutimaris]
MIRGLLCFNRSSINAFSFFGILFFSFYGFVSCKEKDSLFELKDPEATGIYFNNEIVETDSFNILTDEYIFNGGGIAVADFDQNGLPDLFFTGNQVSNKLYLNQGEFKFEDVSSEAGIEAPNFWCTGSVVVDINEDGLLDIYVVSAMKSGPGLRNNLLFINQGKNSEGQITFKEMASDYGIADAGNGMGAAFIDYDLDGDLDLYVLNNEQLEILSSNYREKIVDGSSISNDALYKNNGDNTFTNVTTESGITIEGFGLGLLVGDINNDGWPDIHVSNDYLTNDLLYINNRDGTFSNRIKDKIKHQSQFSMGSDLADINNDLKPDLITLDMLGESNYRKKTTVGRNSYLTYFNNEKWDYEFQYMRNMLHLNNGGKEPFSEIGMYAGVYQTDWSWAPLFGDVDNDGQRDLLITNGFPRDITDKDFVNYRADVGSVATARHLLDSIPIVKIPNYAFKNKGDLTFKDSKNDWGLDKPSFSNGAALVDLDLDGDLDYVVNNINDPAFIFENKLNEKKEKGVFFRIKLHGPTSNPQGLGAKVVLTLSNETKLYQEQQVVRGYMSSIEEILHFGIPAGQTVSNIQVMWPDGKYNEIPSPTLNSKIEISHKTASSGSNSVAILEEESGSVLLEDVSKNLGLEFLHQENDIIDFNVQRTLPHKLSQYGPALAVGDINGDELEDLIVGSSAGYQPQVFLQKSDGTFTQKDLLPGENPNFEEMGTLLLDLDNDGDLDLYLVSGSNEFPADSFEYQDRVYFNDGEGNFMLDQDFSSVKTSGSAVRGADFDQDGFIDLFVGGRTPFAQYPYPERSFLLKNNQGILEDVTDQVAPELRTVGMVTDAIWSDVDLDGLIDLIVVGELMPITVFKNNGSQLKKMKSDLENYLGWWNSIQSGDFDQDGDMDFVVGNLGANNPYHPTFEMPVKIYAKDFDNNGSVDPVIFAWYKNEQEEFESFPSHFWDDLYGQSILFRRKFERYKLYALSTEQTFFSEEERKDALVLKGNFDRSVYLENNGQGKFKVHELPTLAQLAPVNGLLAEDVNQDGFLDILLVGNDFGNEIFIGRLDALNGLLLLGDGNGGFKAATSDTSGFLVPGDGKALVKLSSPNGSSLFIASQNRGELKTFRKKTQTGQAFNPSPEVVAILIELGNGKSQRIEINHGSGFLSQSSKEITLPKDVISIKVIDFKGNEKDLDLSKIN